MFALCGERSGWQMHLVTLAIFAIASAGFGNLSHAHEHAVLPADSGTHGPVPSESIYNLEATWTDHDGRRLLLAALRGKPQIVAMFYASCQYVCPLIVDDMKRVERELTADQRQHVGFALFSFDSERDTPSVLKAYAAKRELDEQRWRLYTGASSDVLELAALLGVRYRREPDGEFSHSTIITVLDRNGVIRYQMLGLNQDRGPLLDALRSALRN